MRTITRHKIIALTSHNIPWFKENIPEAILNQIRAADLERYNPFTLKEKDLPLQRNRNKVFQTIIKAALQYSQYLNTATLPTYRLMETPKRLEITGKTFCLKQPPLGHGANGIAHNAKRSPGLRIPTDYVVKISTSDNEELIIREALFAKLNLNSLGLKRIGSITEDEKKEFCMITKLATGRTYQDNPPLNLKELQQTTRNLLSALRPFEKQNIVHRDLNTGNIIVTKKKCTFIDLANAVQTTGETSINALGEMGSIQGYSYHTACIVLQLTANGKLNTANAHEAAERAQNHLTTLGQQFKTDYEPEINGNLSAIGYHLLANYMDMASELPDELNEAKKLTTQLKKYSTSSQTREDYLYSKIKLTQLLQRYYDNQLSSPTTMLTFYIKLILAEKMPDLNIKQLQAELDGIPKERHTPYMRFVQDDSSESSSIHSAETDS